MSKHARGLYEVLITESLHGELQALDGGVVEERVAPEREEIADLVALHVSRVMERELRMVPFRPRTASRSV